MVISMISVEVVSPLGGIVALPISPSLVSASYILNDIPLLLASRIFNILNDLLDVDRQAKMEA